MNTGVRFREQTGMNAVFRQLTDGQTEWLGVVSQLSSQRTKTAATDHVDRPRLSERFSQNSGGLI
jgi:hypothetical protein